MSIHRPNIWDTVARARAETAGVPKYDQYVSNKRDC
jgi:uncharacterized short protein YbdD (DUF466 family)